MSEHEYEQAVEALVDKGGIRGMLKALEMVCCGKADHLRTNWQDKAAGKAWDRMARVLERAHHKAEELGL
jgi:hypothetical protein